MTPASPRLRPTASASLLLALLLVLVGCAGARLGTSSAGDIRIASLGPRDITVPGDYHTAAYHQPGSSIVSVLASELPIDTLEAASEDDSIELQGQALHIELLWQPIPGRTPLDPTATNLSLRYIVLVNGEVGIYEGGGFGSLADEPGEASLTLHITDATLRLGPATPGFRDLLGPTEVTGSITAQHEPRSARRLHQLLSQHVTDRLGRSLYVLNHP